MGLNVSEWSDMFLWTVDSWTKHVDVVQSKYHHLIKIVVALTIIYCSWKNFHVALNSNNSLIHSSTHRGSFDSFSGQMSYILAFNSTSPLHKDNIRFLNKHCNKNICSFKCTRHVSRITLFRNVHKNRKANHLKVFLN